jgi:tripartite-type tricarboxylate transporter receptor subunit TctC
MQRSRRHILRLAAGAAALPIAPRIAKAQTYPARPVRIVVTTAPGSAADIHARLLGQWLSERLGQSFIIENRPGAGNNIGTEVVVRSRPDGYTLLHVTAAAAINATLYDKLNFNFIRDIAPCEPGDVANVMTVHRLSGGRSEFIAYAKAIRARSTQAAIRAIAGHLRASCSDDRGERLVHPASR